MSPFNFVWKYFYISIAIVIGILFGLGLMTGLIKTSCCDILVKMRSKIKRKNDYRPLNQQKSTKFDIGYRMVYKL